MRIRMSPNDGLALEIDHGGMVLTVETGHLLSVVNSAMQGTPDDTPWFEIEGVAERPKTAGESNAELARAAEDLPEKAADPNDPEGHLPEERKTYKVWKVIGTTADGRYGDFPVRAYSEDEAREIIEDWKAGGFEVERILPPPMQV